jgi:ATP-dependent helicase/nuclease subunit B
VRIRFLLGPAGSGKTFRCLTGVRHALSVSQEGAPLLFVTPKQTTYQVERKFLEYASIPGYTRLFILSFERLAQFIFESAGEPSPRLLDEEGRIMVLRSLLSRHREKLGIFRASSRLTGFAQQLSTLLRDLQNQQIQPDTLRALAGKFSAHGGLPLKLADLAMILELYQDWLDRHQLKDGDCLLTAASGLLKGHKHPISNIQHPENRDENDQHPMSGSQLLASDRIGSRSRKNKSRIADQLVLSLDGTDGKGGGNGAPSSDSAKAIIQIGGLWIDGFAEYSAQEIDFAGALARCCNEATITFCLDAVPSKRRSWLSAWSAVQRSFEEALKHFQSLGGDTVIDILARADGKGRFQNNPVLQHLESKWDDAVAYSTGTEDRQIKKSAQNRLASHTDHPADAIRLVGCDNPESESIFAAREILRHVRGGGRFREIAVLVRNLDGYHEVLQRMFGRYEIPYFLDRRESISHHPLAELTRSALRTVALQWQHEDWFATLKSGLMGVAESEIDELENEALARGWKGRAWQEPLRIKQQPRTEAERQLLIEIEARMEKLRQRIISPFEALAKTAGKNQPVTGPRLAAAVRELWETLGVERALEQWSGEDQLAELPASVHATVWTQMNAWLDTLELAFAEETLALRQWLPILEAGLSQLTIGIIPPALDQVLIGALDRTRNPDAKLVLLLGMNEAVFPALPAGSALLTQNDRAALSGHDLLYASSPQYQLGRERLYAYIACTRASERVLLTWRRNDEDGSPLNPSPFIGHMQRLFPTLELESFTVPDWTAAEHANELIGPLLELRRENQSAIEPLLGVSAVAPILTALNSFRPPVVEEKLAPELAEQLYGPILHTSVSRLEQYAACPFRFFVHSGLRAEERRVFELDFKERGTFQHDALALFHQEVEREQKRWRDLTPRSARSLMGQVARSLVMTYREGLLQSSEEARFTGERLTESLENFVEVLVGWMRDQYLFDPVKVELPFGQEDGPSPWIINLPGGQRLALNGRIDRVDLWTDPESGRRWCVVLDYKSSQKQLDPVLLAHGIQLQLIAYLNVLRNWPDPASFPEARQAIPAGVFYVNLRGKYNRASTRAQALADPDAARKAAYRHAGRFDLEALPMLDGRPNPLKGDQFNYRLNQDGSINKSSREVMNPADFTALLDSVEQNLRGMGAGIFAGNAAVSPFRKGSVKACDQCVCQAVCRIDPWEHAFRILKPPAKPEVAS